MDKGLRWETLTDLGTVFDTQQKIHVHKLFSGVIKCLSQLSRSSSPSYWWRAHLFGVHLVRASRTCSTSGSGMAWHRALLLRCDSRGVLRGVGSKPVQTGDGWKALTNWRSLKSGMSPSDVRAVLGEPDRVKGGDVAFWYYTNGGNVTFISDKVTSWTEPR